MSHVTTLRARGALRTPVIVFFFFFFALLSGCATDEALRSHLTQLDQRATGLEQRIEQLSQAQRGQTDLGAHLEAITKGTRALASQVDIMGRHVDTLQAQQKDSGDRLSRVELSAAQAALTAQQAATTAHLTASSAQTTLQAIAEQANGALAALATKRVPVDQSSAVGPNAATGPPRAPNTTTPDAIPTAPPAQPPPPQDKAHTSTRTERATRPPTVRSTKTQAHTVPTAAPAPAKAAPPVPPAETHVTSAGKGLRTIVPRDTPATPGTPDEAPPATVETAYHFALEAFSRQRYSEAIQRLEELRRLHPDTPLAALSLYRLGEAHYAQQAYPHAAQAFQAFLALQPSGAHVPSILLKLGLIAQTTGNLPEARQRFTALTTDYPDSQEAAMARKLLDTIGHAQ